MEDTKLLTNQIVSLAWIRCLQEEGVDFVNKETGIPEKDERVIYEAFESQSGLFDVPKANASRYGIEKNILEVYGSHCLYNDDPYLLNLLLNEDLKRSLLDKIDSLNARGTSTTPP
jgi:hypothetical protein